MKIGIGRKQIVLSVVDTPRGCRSQAIDVPQALDASDRELARLNSDRMHGADRLLWESSALLYGGFWPRWF